VKDIFFFDFESVRGIVSHRTQMHAQRTMPSEAIFHTSMERTILFSVMSEMQELFFCVMKEHFSRLYRHGLGKSETEDAIDTLEVRAVARSDASELGECVVVAELHDVVCLVALERRVVSVLQEELSMLDVPEGLGLAWVEPGMVDTICEQFFFGFFRNVASTCVKMLCKKNFIMAVGLHTRIAENCDC
jgi:hypothetical protein